MCVLKSGLKRVKSGTFPISSPKRGSFSLFLTPLDAAGLAPPVDTRRLRQASVCGTFGEGAGVRAPGPGPGPKDLPPPPNDHH